MPAATDKQNNETQHDFLTSRRDSATSPSADCVSNSSQWLMPTVTDKCAQEGALSAGVAATRGRDVAAYCGRVGTDQWGGGAP